MTFEGFLKSWRRRLRPSRPARRAARTRLTVESLEERAVPSGDPIGTPPVVPEEETGGTGDGDPGPIDEQPPVPSDTRFIIRLYQDLLARTPSTTEVGFWQTHLDAGLPRGVVSNIFTSTQEYRVGGIQGAYHALLGRDADPSGIGFWDQFLSQGGTEEQVQAALLASDEFYWGQQAHFRYWRDEVQPNIPNARHRTHFSRDPDQDWVVGVYGLALGRLPDDSARYYWSNALKQGVSRFAVASTILGTAEARSWTIADQYLDVVGRVPEAAAAAAWQFALAHGARPEQLASALAGSEEYFANVSKPNPITTPGTPQALGVVDPLNLTRTDGVGPQLPYEIHGTGTPGSSVVIRVNNRPQLRVRVGSDGTWRGTLPGLPIGEHETSAARMSDGPGRGRSPSGSGAPTTPARASDSEPTSDDESDAGLDDGTPTQRSHDGRGHNFTVAPAAREPLDIRPGQQLVVNASPGVGFDLAEIDIDINPTNALQMFVFANPSTLGTGQPGTYGAYSRDGGNTWIGRLIGDGTDGLPTGFGDPTIAWDAFGNLFLAYLDFTDTSRINILWSPDGGITFRVAGQVQGLNGRGGVSDQPTLAVGPDATNPGGQALFVVYADLGGAGTGLLTVQGMQIFGFGNFARFGARDFVLVANSNFGDIAVGPNGEVLITAQTTNNTDGPSFIFTDLDPDGLGSATFNPPVLVNVSFIGSFSPIPAQANRTIDAEASLAWDRTPRAFTGDVARIYLTYVDRETLNTDDTNILFYFSDDNGGTWNGPVQINDDSDIFFGPPLGINSFATLSTNSQFQPTISVDPTTGWVGMSWYDARFDTGGTFTFDNLANNDVMQFGTVSFDGGQSWLANFPITASQSSTVINTNGGFDFGDYNHSVFFGGIFYPAWSDNSTTLPGGRSPSLSIGVAAIRFGPPPPPPAPLVIDRFEPNQTSDRSTNLGVLAAGAQTFANLSVLRGFDGLPDYDWYTFTTAQSGVLQVALQRTLGNLEVEVYQLANDGSLQLIGRGLQPGAANVGTAVQVQAGRQYFVVAKGLPQGIGIQGESGYDLVFLLT